MIKILEIILKMLNQLIHEKEVILITNEFIEKFCFFNITLYTNRVGNKHLKVNISSTFFFSLTRLGSDPQFKFDRVPNPTTLRGAVDDFDLGSQLEKPLIVVNGYGPRSFRINGEDVRGSVLLFRDAHFSWNIAHFEQITPQSLAPIQLHHPTPGT